ncbi:hypothetical protein CDL60_07295 [Roseateles noduli]|nr:hypothetical protein CDL60_07295 [Roseateles noduli]
MPERKMNPLTSGASSADMYLDLSLKRAGKVKGESTSAGHANDIVVRGFSWGVGAAGDAVAGQQTGRRSYRQLTITKGLDAASTALMSAVATNDEVKSSKLYLRKAGGSQEDYFCLTLEKARIASYDIDCDETGAPVERISMSFQKVNIEYRTQNAKGAMGGTHTFDDDLT